MAKINLNRCKYENYQILEEGDHTITEVKLRLEVG